MTILGYGFPINAVILIGFLFLLDAILFSYQLWREHQQAQRRQP
jgi:hypothetical protein